MTEPPTHHNPDYLAKDYESFRALLLDHLTALAPGSAPVEIASVESVLAETLAYVGDYLSYFQDAVATEAYPATARQRVSLRRHARLVDYAPNEGCSARVWARIEVAAEAVTLKRGTQLLAGLADARSARLPADFDTDGREVFETMHEARLMRAHNRMALAPPGILEGGATSARLAGHFPGLFAGDVLVLRESGTLWAHAVRLVGVSPGEQETRIDWHVEDALPAVLPAGKWEVFGNVVLADHGRSDQMILDAAPRNGEKETRIYCPHLAFTTPCQHGPSGDHSAAATMRQDPRSAEPAIALAEEASFLPPAALARRPLWEGRRDLVHASQFDRAFAVEPEGDGHVILRFGDGFHARRLQPDWTYRVLYRTGIGSRGNIGANTLSHIVTDDDRIVAVANPIAASGGVDPESSDDIRLLAPVAAEAQRRCVTEQDYVEKTCLFGGVRAAVASRAWFPGGSEVTVRVCRDGDQAWDSAFAGRLSAWLASFQLIGDSLTIVGADYVVPVVALALEIEPGQMPDTVFGAVRDLLASSMSFTFGEPLDPQDLAACARGVPGVADAQVIRATRPGQTSSAVAPGPIEVRPNEVIRLDPRRIELVLAQPR